MIFCVCSELFQPRNKIPSPILVAPDHTVWNVWLDQELRIGDEAASRALLDRITSLALSTKKMKHFFKRYLEFERARGNAAGIEHVKARARSYVESKMA